jgi:dienelactone hydrolase
MRLMFVWLLLAAATPSIVTAQDDPLTRRADLGAVIRPPAATAPARVLRIAEASALHRAGLRAGDDIIALDGRRFADAVDFDRRILALRGSQTVTLQVRRDGKDLEMRAQLTALRRDQINDVDVLYTYVTNPRGPRQRAILTRPSGNTARRPAILFVPWLSCDSIESPMGPSAGIDELLYRVAAESGWVLLRVDKPGVGDSEGVCADTDLDTEIAGSQAALTWLRTHDWVDPTRIVIMGHSFSGAFLPLVAGTRPVAGYIVLNSWVRTWMERLLDFERLQAEASGMSPADVSERQRKLSEFYALFLEQQKTPRQIATERPDLASVWTDMPEHQYGRSARFHHQLQRINAARGWSSVSVPTLAMWSDADLVMHRDDHERLTALVNRNRPGAAEFVVVPGADHALAAPNGAGQRHLPPLALSAVQKFLNRVQAGAGHSQ